MQIDSSFKEGGFLEMASFRLPNYVHISDYLGAVYIPICEEICVLFILLTCKPPSLP